MENMSAFQISLIFGGSTILFCIILGTIAGFISKGIMDRILEKELKQKKVVLRAELQYDTGYHSYGKASVLVRLKKKQSIGLKSPSNAKSEYFVAMVNIETPMTLSRLNDLAKEILLERSD